MMINSRLKIRFDGFDACEQLHQQLSCPVIVNEDD